LSTTQNINQQFIADQLKISVGTVSKALRGYPDIGIKTREAVTNLAKEIGYNPNGSYTQNRFVGVLVQGDVEYRHDDIINGYLAGISSLASKLNYSIIIHFCDRNDCESILQESSQPPAMREGLLSGLILLRRWPEEIAAELSKILPCVSIVNKTHNANIDVVGIDNFGGIDTLVSHLHSLGHEKIGFFGRCIGLSWSLERYAGYIASMARNQLDFEKEWIVDIDSKLMDSRTLLWEDCFDFARIKHLYESGVTAFVCSNDSCAESLSKWFTENNFNVPRDVSITGFHGGFTLNGYNSLTNVSFDNARIGASALRTLEYKIKHKTESRQEIIFPSTFVQGDSTTVAPR
jgi:LacI family transcriptional regulator